MAYISPEYLATLQKRNDFVYFKVLDSSGKFIINQLDTDIGIDASSQLLQETLENIQADFVVVKLYANKPEKVDTAATNQTKVLTLKVKLEGNSNSSLGYIGKVNYQGAGNSVPLKEFLDLLNENQKLKFEIHKLEQDLENTLTEEETSSKPTSLLDHPLASTIAGLLINKLKEKPSISKPDTEHKDLEFTKAVNDIASFKDGKRTLVIIANLGADTWENMILPPLKEKLGTFYGN